MLLSAEYLSRVHLPFIVACSKIFGVLDQRQTNNQILARKKSNTATFENAMPLSVRIRIKVRANGFLNVG